MKHTYKNQVECEKESIMNWKGKQYPHPGYFTRNHLPSYGMAILLWILAASAKTTWGSVGIGLMVI